MKEYYEYYWRPGHDIEKPKGIKVGTKVLYKGKECEVYYVDRHVHPICIKGYGRVELKDCEVIS